MHLVARSVLVVILMVCAGAVGLQAAHSAAVQDPITFGTNVYLLAVPVLLNKIDHTQFNSMEPS